MQLRCLAFFSIPIHSSCNLHGRARYPRCRMLCCLLPRTHICAAQQAKQAYADQVVDSRLPPHRTCHTLQPLNESPTFDLQRMQCARTAGPLRCMLFHSKSLQTAAAADTQTTSVTILAQGRQGNACSATSASEHIARTARCRPSQEGHGMRPTSRQSGTAQHAGVVGRTVRAFMVHKVEGRLPPSLAVVAQDGLQPAHDEE